MARYTDPYNGDTYDTTATAAEIEMEKKKLSRQIEDDWTHLMKIDSALQAGIRNGQTFREFQSATGAPGTLERRYRELQRRSGIAPHTTKPDPFVAGFKSGKF
jgi:hypothetical protein